MLLIVLDLLLPMGRRLLLELSPLLRRILATLRLLRLHSLPSERRLEGGEGVMQGLQRGQRCRLGAGGVPCRGWWSHVGRRAGRGSWRRHHSSFAR